MASKRRLTIGLLKIFVISVLVILLISTYNCNGHRRFPKPKYNFGVIPAVSCLVFDPTFIKFHVCHLKPINRTFKIIYGHAVFLKPLYKDVMMTFRMMKKTDGGYKPYGIDTNFDACKYMAGKKIPGFDWFFNFVAPYTNINHSCPYDSDVYVKYPVRQVELPSLFPEGDYRFEIKVDTEKIPRVAVHAYVTITVVNKRVVVT